MSILDDIKQLNATKKELTKFGLTVGVVLCIIGFFLWYREVNLYIFFIFIGSLFIILKFLSYCF